MRRLRTMRMALTALTAHKMRSALTVLGIVIGVAAVISLVSIGRGSQASVTSRIESLGSNLLFVYPGATSQGGVRGAQGSAATLTLEDAAALADPSLAPSVAAVAPQAQTSAQVAVQGQNTNAQVLGVTPEYQFVRNYEVAAGAFISLADMQNSSPVAVLGSQVVQTLFAQTSPVGQAIKIRGGQYTVIGVLQSKGGTGFGSVDNVVLIPITTMQYRLSAQRTATGDLSVQVINVQVVNASEMDAASQQIAYILRERHRIVGQDDFTISSQQDILQTLQETTQVWVVFLGIIASISLLVGGIGIMNIMLVSVTERTREIGLRKAVGAKRQDILLQFLVESALLSLGGGMIGVLVGVGVSRFASGLSLGGQTIQTVISPDIALLAVAVAAAIGILFGLYPAYRAARLNPIEALRYE